jgi:DNA-binding transcriptional regulator GbsR (MarR family)
MEVDMHSLSETPLEIFIEGWGRMGTQWGISKVMAEIYALLYMSEQPLNLEEMSDRLQTSRSNISTNVRSLLELGIVRKAIIRGDRRDYYTIEADIRRVAVRIAEGKKKREMDPALDIINNALEAAIQAKQRSVAADESVDFYITRLQALKQIVEAVESIFKAFIIGDDAGAENLESSEIYKS